MFAVGGHLRETLCEAFSTGLKLLIRTDTDGHRAAPGGVLASAVLLGSGSYGGVSVNRAFGAAGTDL